MAKLNTLEKALEAALVTAIAKLTRLTEMEAEEVVVQPKNRWLKGGRADARLHRERPDLYIGAIDIIVPCQACRDDDRNYCSCNSPLMAALAVGFPPETVPEEFHRNVGQPPKAVMEWVW